jgi:FlaA1/EpsC-like NDP-sugar epimerase
VRPKLKSQSLDGIVGMRKLKEFAEKLSAGFLIKIGIDFFIILTAYYVSYLLRFGGDIPQLSLQFCLNSLPMVLLVKLYYLHDFGLFKADWRYTSTYDVMCLLKASFAGSITVVIAIWLSGLIEKLPRSVIVTDWCLNLVLLGGVRIIPRLVAEGLDEPFWMYVYYLVKYRKLHTKNRHANLKNALIFGAGDVGEMIVREMKLRNDTNYRPIGFIDDDEKKKGKVIHGVEVLGGRTALEMEVEKKKVDEIIISLENVRGKELREVVKLCEKTNRRTTIVPSLSEIVDGKISVSDVRTIRLEDLLGREPINLNTESISGYLKGKRVLVTGAGGSIGSELCRQIMKFDPALLILFGRGENSIFQIHNELRVQYPKERFPQVIGDVINKAKVEKIFETFKPEIVFHAGADKHVPLMEMNPDEAILNNIIGTRNVIETCDRFEVDRLICISTDKAVNPTSIMGVCKRVAEKLIQCRKNGKTRVMGVRFGNVLGSRGSVVPLFERQIREGGPMTVTHKDMTRFLMTIPEAAQLVIQAGALGENGDQFVLDMGDPVNIDELARTMIRLAGLKPDEDIEIVYSGIRPGEKLYEELTCLFEKQVRTEHPKLIKIVEDGQQTLSNGLASDIEELRDLAINMNYDGIYRKLRQMVPEYQPNSMDDDVCRLKESG